MIDYTFTSRYYHINEDPSIIQIDLINMNLPYTETYVRKSEENRPALVAQRVYNNPNYWWVICQYNGILDPKILPNGTLLRIPNLTKAPREGIV